MKTIAFIKNQIEKLSELIGLLCAMPVVLLAINIFYAVVLDTFLSDALFKEVLESQRSYLAKTREWTKISDLAYLNN